MLLVLGVIVGLVLGLTGAGGGILAVPALMAVTGWSLARVAPVALLAVAAGASLGTLSGLRQGIVRWRAALLMALASVPFSWLGQTVAAQLPPTLLKLFFAAIVLLVAGRVLLGHEPMPGEHHEQVLCPSDPLTGRFIWQPRTMLVIGLVGMLAGLLTGLLGVGGGFAIVPALRLISDLTLPVIISTSMMVIMLVSSVGMGIALLRGLSLEPSVALPFMTALCAGLLLGRQLLLHLSSRHVAQGFAILLLAVAVSLIRGALTG